MKIIYNLFLAGYYASLRTAAAFGHAKASAWVNGRENYFSNLEAKIKSSQLDLKSNIYWFHCSSLGEFEQGRPLIESIKRSSPETGIVLSFFSPSGFEIRKEYTGADVVCYLPFDSESNAKKFVEMIKPSKAFFVKYDLWYNFLDRLSKNKIPHYLISASFRKEHYFFATYGKWALNKLKRFSHIFTSDQESETLLKQHRINNVTIAGDTRIDRVLEIKNTNREIPGMIDFAGDKKIIICGSTWEPDEVLIGNFYDDQNINHGYKLVIAPHETGEKKIKALKERFRNDSILYSDLLLDFTKGKSARILIIDNVGMLSALYRYAHIAYIGGGFGTSIHNTLEPAAFGLPVIFGPNYGKFREAVDLIKLGGAFCINDFEQLKKTFLMLLENDVARKQAADVSKNYILQHSGAVEIIQKRMVD